MPPKRRKVARRLFNEKESSAAPAAEDWHVTQQAEAIVQQLEAKKKTASTLQHLLQKYPSLVYDVRAMGSSTGGPGSAGPSHAPGPSTTPGWCVCGNCQIMDSQEENVCCGQTSCIINDPNVQLIVLSHGAVAAGMLLHSELRGDSPDLLQRLDEPGAYARPLRWHAYRLYMVWRCGYLGRGNRQPVAACVVCAIRRKWPSPDGRYTGFRSLMERL